MNLQITAGNKRWSTFLTAIALLIALTVGSGESSPDSAGTPHTVPVTNSTTVPAAVSINLYGCAGLVGSARSVYVAAFVLGYCLSVYVLQGTPWGRAFTSAIVNGACRMPWPVRAATMGRFDTR